MGRDLDQGAIDRAVVRDGTGGNGIFTTARSIALFAMRTAGNKQQKRVIDRAQPVLLLSLKQLQTRISPTFNTVRTKHECFPCLPGCF